MRVLFPMEEGGLRDTTPHEVSQSGILMFENLQKHHPGHAQEPIIPGLPYAVYLPNALGPLDPEMFLWYQLEGQWRDLSVSVKEDGGVLPHDTPTVVLNLIQLNRN